MLTGPLLGKCRGRAIPQSGVSPLPVIKQLDVLRDLAPSLLTGFVAPMMHQFILQRSPETLHRGVVIAVPLPTHGRRQAILAEVLLVDLGTILRAPIGVVDQSRA